MWPPAALCFLKLAHFPAPVVYVESSLHKSACKLLQHCAALSSYTFRQHLCLTTTSLCRYVAFCRGVLSRRLAISRTSSSQTQYRTKHCLHRRSLSNIHACSHSHDSVCTHDEASDSGIPEPRCSVICQCSSSVSAFA